MAVAVDNNGQAVITGRTASTSFPVSNAFQSTRRGNFDSFVSKLNAGGSALIFSTYLGGTGDDNLAGDPAIATDPGGNIYVTGTTDSTDFPTMNPVQVARAGGTDAFLSKFNSQGALIHSTYLGGAQDDTGLGVAAERHFSRPSVAEPQLGMLFLARSQPTAVRWCCPHTWEEPWESVVMLSRSTNSDSRWLQDLRQTAFR
jgi:hypothetical protein